VAAAIVRDAPGRHSFTVDAAFTSPVPRIERLLFHAFRQPGGAMPTKFLMLPPQTTATRDWAARLAAAMPEVAIVVAENAQQAEQAVADADAAFMARSCAGTPTAQA
jgi:hypothetical protein